jgi:cyclic-di-GMP-binding protein
VPTFDVVSELDLQEVRNAVDQANREATTRFDFKGTDARIDFTEKELTLHASTEDRLRALYSLLEEKMVKRSVSLKSLEAGKIEEASHQSARQKVALKAGISQEVGKQINKIIKEAGLKGVSSSIQGDQVRVTGKQRDDLQAAIALLKESDVPVPLQFTNFRD